MQNLVYTDIPLDIQHLRATDVLTVYSLDLRSLLLCASLSHAQHAPASHTVPLKASCVQSQPPAATGSDCISELAATACTQIVPDLLPLSCSARRSSVATAFQVSIPQSWKGPQARAPSRR